jgi:hypothetical protein
MPIRKHRSIWTFVQDPATVGGQSHGDTCFNPATGESWVWDKNFSVWNPFRLTNTAGVGTAGYFEKGASYSSSSIDKMAFATETVATITSNSITVGYSDFGGASWGSGYMLGGLTAPYTTNATIRGLAFSSDATRQLASNLASGHEDGPSVQSVASCYQMGGNVGQIALPGFTGIDRLSFASEASTRLSTTMANVHGNTTSGGFSAPAYGYGSGGTSDLGTSVVTNIDRLSFSTEQVAQLATGLGTGWQAHASHSSPFAGYMTGGNPGNGTTPPYHSRILRMVFASEVITTLATTLTRNHFGACPSQSRQAGYQVGGNYSGSATTMISKLIFSNETTASVTSGLTVARYSPAPNLTNLN